jgi:uncharacterized protein
MRHWNAICHNLQSDDEFFPVLINDESGVAPANDWATGFMRGVDMRRDSWLALMNDDDHAGVLIPIMAWHMNITPSQKCDHTRNR